MSENEALDHLDSDFAENVAPIIEFIEWRQIQGKVRDVRIADDLGVHRHTVASMCSEEKFNPKIQNLVDVVDYLEGEIYVRDFGGCATLDEKSADGPLATVLGSTDFDFGDYVRARRKNLGLSLARLSESIGCSNNTVLKFEKEPWQASYRTAFQIMRALNLEFAVRPSTADMRLAARVQRTLQ